MKAMNLPQPLGYYHALTGNDSLHFGYWPDHLPELGLGGAQQEHSRMILRLLPPAPARILDVGCGLGVMAGVLADEGYQVVAIAPSAAMIDYAREHYPGPEYIACGFLDDVPSLSEPQSFDVLLFQESLQYFPDLWAVFARAKRLLRRDGGRLIACDEVSYAADTREYSAVHQVLEVERAFAGQGFYVRTHQRIGNNVTPSCRAMLELFRERRDMLTTLFGVESGEPIADCMQAWQRLGRDYESGRMGYELWELLPSDFALRTYRDGDEQKILPAFRAVFQTTRSTPHWLWKFKQNPFGGPSIATVWDGGNLASHYAGYPVPVWQGGEEKLTYQVGDTFTMPPYRGEGRGTTSLLARALRFFHRHYSENRVPFDYGFNTGKIQKFGRLFLNYSPVAPVYQWHLQGPELQRISGSRSAVARLLGYRAQMEKEVGDWAQTVYETVRGDYAMMVARTTRYLRWRYQLHPDFDYRFVVIHRWGKPVGWWLGRVEGDTLLLGDALFGKSARLAPWIGLAIYLKQLKREGVAVNCISGWFSETPPWWVRRLQATGFRKQREKDHLDLCVTSFIDEVEAADIGRDFYFTHGDSDPF